MTGFQCGYCKRTFRSESTLAAHSCAQKRRYTDRDSTSSRIALGLYQRFFEINSPGSRTKTFDDLATSRYYQGFIRLARHLQDLRPIDQDRFVDWLFHNNIKERQWCLDKTYERYLIDLLLKETTDRALERSIETMARWADEHGRDYREFFREVSPAQATHMIRYGWISPWVLYLANSADCLWERLSDEQGEIIGQVIDPTAWRKRFETKIQDQQYVKGLLDEAGL